MTHLLDSDHLSILERPAASEYPAVVGHISRHAPGDVAASVVSIQEQVLGANALIHQAKSVAELVKAYQLITRMVEVIIPRPVLPFDDPAAVLFWQFRAQKIRIGTMDLRIASIALSRNLVVVTRNARDFGQVPGLSTADWTR